MTWRRSLASTGRGIAVLSGSRAREYSYEGRPIGPELPRSVFTEGLAVGLATGAADTDGNGIVTVAEAYNYAYRYVSQNTPRQAPQYYLEDGHGEIVLAACAAADAPARAAGARGRCRHPQAHVSGRSGARRLASRARRWRTSRAPRSARRTPRRRWLSAAPAPRAAAPPPAAPPASPTPVLGQSPAAHAAAADTSAVILEQDRDNAYCVVVQPGRQAARLRRLGPPGPHPRRLRRRAGARAASSPARRSTTWRSARTARSSRRAGGTAQSPCAR